MATLLILVAGGMSFQLPVTPGGFLPGMPAALADDDDDGDDDDDDDGGAASGGRSGEGRGRDDGGERRPAADLRSLFRWPARERERPPVRRKTVIPDRVANELVALGLDDASIAALGERGFSVGERQTIGFMQSELVRLGVPQGMTLDEARQQVLDEEPSAIVDVHHLYQPEQSAASPGCSGDECRLVRATVGWPVKGFASSCAPVEPIGLIDTSINAGHAALENARIEVVRLGEGTGPASGAAHGTAVAALLVGAPDSRAPGLLPASRLVAVDAFRRFQGRADVANVYDLVHALDILAGKSVRVINLSLGGPSNLVLEKAVNTLAGQGIILIAAAGNDGPNARPVFPAGYDTVIAVTAVDRSGKAYRRAVRGEHIDIAAPGVGVWTAASVSGARQKNGTSFAAPFVTAAVALMQASEPQLTPADIQTRLGRMAEDIGAPGRDPVFGWGLLNARSLCTRT